MRLNPVLLHLSALIALLSACSSSREEIGEEMRCQAGTYRMASGALIDIGLSSAQHLRWRLVDGRVGRVRREEDQQTWTGTTGWTAEPDPARIQLGDCTDRHIQVTGIDGIDGQGTRIELRTSEVRFKGADVELAGRLVLPEGEGQVPLAVLVHGSEDTSALDFYYNQRLLPARGIGVFVYDKRGTGASSGAYSQDFHLLAADAAAAHQTALNLAGDRVAYSGYMGGSQGGWVAPLAATLSPADFVIANYGLAESALAEDRDEVQLRLREAGYGADAQAKAREITDITGRLLVTNFEDGAEDLARARAAYEDDAWFTELEGGVSWEMVSRPLWQFRIGYFFLDVGTSWDYEPLPVLRDLDTPMLWVLAGDDRSAPPQNTRKILTALQQEGRPIDIAFFPNAEHGMTLYKLGDDGQRLSLSYAPGYFPLLADWIHSRRLGEGYADAELAPRRDEQPVSKRDISP
ncbi:MAG: prolyl oligopeptidase family serine peptidase [Pseudomonadota bacterium]